MDLWKQFAEKLPTGKRGKAIKALLDRVSGQTGDVRALSHVTLYEIYSWEAEHRRLLSKAFRHLAQYHLQEALVWLKYWPRPLGIFGAIQIKEGDLWNGLKYLSQFIEKQRLWIQIVSGPKDSDSDRLELCRRLALGAAARCQLGQFSGAREWFSEAFEEFKLVDINARIEELGLEGSILVGIASCLLLEFRYVDAEKFIDDVLSQKVFSAYQSSARQSLIASKELLTTLPDAARDFHAPPAAEELWAELMDDVQRCDTPEEARVTRRKILITIKANNANRQIQSLASAVETAMTRQIDELETVEPSGETDSEPCIPDRDLSKVSPEVREQLEEMTQATRALAKQFWMQRKQLRDMSHLLVKATRRLVESNIAGVRDIAGNVYRIPAQYQIRWLWWNTARFMVQIIVFAYFLDKVLDKFLEERGKSLLEILNFAHKDLILLVALLLIGFVLGHFAERKLDDLILPRYKHLLTRIVSDRSHRLWTTYNTLLKLLAEAKQALGELEKRIGSPDAKGLPSEC
jgi:hypothetical protein